MTHGKSEATYICLPFISILFGFWKGLNRFQGCAINKIHKTQIQIPKSIRTYDSKIDLITGLWKSLNNILYDFKALGKSSVILYGPYIWAMIRIKISLKRNSLY